MTVETILEKEILDLSPPPSPTPGILPDELRERIAKYESHDPALKVALNELGTFIEAHAGMQSQRDRFGSDLHLVKAQLQRAKDLLEEIGALDAQRGHTHNRIAAVDTQQLPGGVIVDEDRLEGFSDDGHHPCQ